ncbi:MAG: HD domain-containing phosphohydrolase [Planctomycetota bacterium]
MDDDEQFLEMNSEILRGAGYSVQGYSDPMQAVKDGSFDPAPAGEHGPGTLNREGRFAVVVSDMRMPNMNGIQFLAKVKERAPDAVRVMLTGHADLATAVEAVNEDNIFRFLVKPCSPESLLRAIADAVRQYQLIVAERELLEKTLNGSINVLTEILSIVEPQSFDHAQRLCAHLHTFARTVAIPNSWQLEMAAMLADIGFVTIPQEVIVKARQGARLKDVERRMLDRVPEIGRNLLAHVPRLEGVAALVLYQNKHFDGSGFPRDELQGAAIPLGARILKLLSDLVQLEDNGVPMPEALKELDGRLGWYDPALLASVHACFASQAEALVQRRPPMPVSVRNLHLGQILQSDVLTAKGTLLISAGHLLSETLLERIRNFSRLVGVQGPVYIRAETLEVPR